MQNEKIVAITTSSTGTTVYGLSSSGHLVIFDPEAGWVMRCGPTILTVDRANVIKMPIERSFYSEPKSRYDYSKEENEIEIKRGFRLSTPINVIIALLGLSILLYFFTRH